MRRVLHVVMLLVPAAAVAQDLVVLRPPAPSPTIGATHLDEAFADHEARAHRLMAAVCLGCGSADENEDAPALAIPDLPPEP